MNFKINCKIYPKIVHVFYSNTLESAKQEYEKTYKVFLSEDMSTWQALTIYPIKHSKYPSSVIILLNKNSKELLTDIHHESIHASIWILKEVGVEISFNNDEAITYLSSYMFKEIVKKCITDGKPNEI